jgi:hypothetical protein
MVCTRELYGKEHGLWRPNNLHHEAKCLILEAYITLLGHDVTPKGEITLFILYFKVVKENL